MIRISLGEKRQALIKARKALSNDSRQSASERICERFIISTLYTEAKHIAVYIDTRAEVETNRLIKAIHDSGKHCYLPTINSDKSSLPKSRPSRRELQMLINLRAGTSM